MSLDTPFDLEPLREKIIRAMYEHATFDGWNARALEDTANAVNIDVGMANCLFPNGTRDLIFYASKLADTDMCQAFKEANTSHLRISEQAVFAIMLRFKAYQDHREAVRRAVVFLMLPGNQALALELTKQTCHQIWNLLNDQSTDWNWYTKRALLAGVFLSSLPVWLNDQTPDLYTTESFVKRRIENVLNVAKKLKKSNQNINLGKALPVLGTVSKIKQLLTNTHHLTHNMRMRGK